MVCLTLEAARLPCIRRALAARLAGNWVSIFMYPRPLCCILDGIFGLGSKSFTDADEVVLLSRRIAEELTLASVFGLLALSDIPVPYDTSIYATDSSSTKGAFTALHVGREVEEVVWPGGDKKGTYTVLDSPARQMLKTLGEDLDEVIEEDLLQAPARVLDFRFDAVEICGG